MSASKKPRAKQQPPASPKADWDRDQLSVRLTAARRERLRQIAATMPPGAKPGDAVDRAIERALAPAEAARPEAEIDGSRFDDLEELAERLGRDRSNEAREIAAQCSKTLDEVRAIAGLLSAIASSPAGEESEEDWEPEAPPPRCKSLSDWLSAQPVSNGRVQAVARWSSKTRVSSMLVKMEFEIGPEKGIASPSKVRVDLIPTSSPFARVDTREAFHISGAKNSTGAWVVALRELNPDRSPGALLGQARL